jgi:hypothetical protein
MADRKITPARITLPPRSNAVTYSDEYIAEIAEALDDCPAGEAVIADEIQDTEAKARDRAKKVANAVMASDDNDHPKVKAHSVPGEDENGDAGFIPAVSLPVGR